MNQLVKTQVAHAVKNHSYWTEAEILIRVLCDRIEGWAAFGVDGPIEGITISVRASLSVGFGVRVEAAPTKTFPGLDNFVMLKFFESDHNAQKVLHLCKLLQDQYWIGVTLFQAIESFPPWFWGGPSSDCVQVKAHENRLVVCSQSSPSNSAEEEALHVWWYNPHWGQWEYSPTNKRKTWVCSRFYRHNSSDALAQDLQGRYCAQLLC